MHYTLQYLHKIGSHHQPHHHHHPLHHPQVFRPFYTILNFTYYYLILRWLVAQRTYQVKLTLCVPRLVYLASDYRETETHQNDNGVQNRKCMKSVWQEPATIKYKFYLIKYFSLITLNNVTNVI